jgi:SAM-dependent methyltransferase
MLRGYFHRLRRHLKTLGDFKHQSRLWWLSLRHNAEYRRYLRSQLARTLSKNRTAQHSGTARNIGIFIDRIFELAPPDRSSKILCIGPRNTAEIEYFRSKGITDIVGIDLFSQSTDILVMDMHEMTFPDNHFDVIYSSHSLEHAYDPHKVASEIVRVSCPGALVAIEVPIHYQVHSADRLDLESTQGIHSLFSSAIAQVLWSDEQPPHSSTNGHGTSIARTLFKIHKGNR